MQRAVVAGISPADGFPTLGLVVLALLQTEQRRRGEIRAWRWISRRCGGGAGVGEVPGWSPAAVRRNKRFARTSTKSAREDMYQCCEAGLFGAPLSPEVKYTTSWQPPTGGSRDSRGVHGVGPWGLWARVWGGRGAQRSEDEAQARLDRDAPGSHLFDMLLFVGGACINVLRFSLKKFGR